MREHRTNAVRHGFRKTAETVCKVTTVTPRRVSKWHDGDGYRRRYHRPKRALGLAATKARSTPGPLLRLAFRRALVKPSRQSCTETTTDGLPEAVKRQTFMRRKAPGLKTPPVLNEPDKTKPAARKDGGLMAQGEFYEWCKRTGNLALYRRLYPEP